LSTDRSPQEQSTSVLPIAQTASTIRNANRCGGCLMGMAIIIYQQRGEGKVKHVFKWTAIDDNVIRGINSLRNRPLLLLASASRRHAMFIDHRLAPRNCNLSTFLGCRSFFYETGQMDDCRLENLSLLNFFVYGSLLGTTSAWRRRREGHCLHWEKCIDFSLHCSGWMSRSCGIRIKLLYARNAKNQVSEIWSHLWLQSRLELLSISCRHSFTRNLQYEAWRWGQNALLEARILAIVRCVLASHQQSLLRFSLQKNMTMLQNYNFTYWNSQDNTFEILMIQSYRQTLLGLHHFVPLK